MVSIKRSVRKTPPSVPFDRIANQVLGKNYSLSIVLCADGISRKLNRQFRNKDYPTNILSFPLDKNTGEIFLNIKKAALEARKLGVPLPSYTAYLFIHGLLHLKGFAHGSTMERKERALLKSLGLAKNEKMQRFIAS